jgi:cytochrome c-type biogenesis protein CcsB
MTLQNYLANYSFLTLLGSMVFYWIETAFAGLNSARPLSNPKAPNSVVVATSSQYSVQQLAQAELQHNEKLVNNLGNQNQSFAKYGVILSNVLLGLLLVLRWKESGHFPLSNLYESLMFLSWCFTLLHLYIDFGLRKSYASANMLKYTVSPARLKEEESLWVQTPGSSSNELGFKQKQPSQGELFLARKQKSEFTQKLFGAITTPSALLTNAFATFSLPQEMQEASPLVPALQSNWLMMHVTVMILSYAALILGSLLSIAFLIVTMDSPQISEAKGEEQKKEKLQSIASTLDNLSYRILGIAFPLLTIGILSGAVWANEAWGSYWSWDPKETWALLTWLIFAIYLHTRISKGWAGKKPAIIASFGFVIVWICYLGVNLIGEGLHSYGWIVQS